MERILVAIDSSDASKSVFNMAISLAKARNATIMLLHVLCEEDSNFPSLPTYAYYSILMNNDGGVFQEKFIQYKQREIEYLRYLTEQAIALGIDIEYAQLSGIPGWEICELASNWSADLIIIGSRGLKGLQEMLMGSVSNYVTHHAPCSVLLVRTDTDLSSSYSTDFLSQAEKADYQSKIMIDR